jgi:adenosylcobinamide-GDP ribazoletransferase
MPSLLADLVAALQLLTRLPVSWIGIGAPQPALTRIVWAYPVVGALVGAIGGGVYWIAEGLGCPPALAALWSIAALVLATGAMHEDGLADMADGFGGGATRERKLEIMRDSRIGSYGAIALMLSLGLRAAAVALLADPLPALVGLVVSGALGRAVAVGLLALLPPARSDGLAAESGGPDRSAAGAGLTLAVVAALVLLPTGAALAAIAAAAIACAVLAGLARRQIGGHTGDVLGAGEQLGECLVLTVLVAAL